MTVGGVLETCLYAADLAAAEAFYTSALGLEVLARAEGRHVFFRCGAGVFLVFNPERTAAEQTHVGGAPVPVHGAVGPGHVAFAVPAAELEGWRRRLAGLGVPVESEVRWPRGGASLYLRDPAGNVVELASPAIWGLPDASAEGGG
jgi:catechol 2,3-dioxygenase-like lactoylglutathione lyase family enzyme